MRTDRLAPPRSCDTERSRHADESAGARRSPRCPNPRAPADDAATRSRSTAAVTCSGIGWRRPATGCGPHPPDSPARKDPP
ncbi:hypothetical protein GCM10023224_17070 [Streptomonospora halophila]|uniref:Uncharacterized protein n=1 Tax=Streptomonospora halophila TaxID=427369 RepID=A0ABP9GEU3_9ACTN